VHGHANGHAVAPLRAFTAAGALRQVPPYTVLKPPRPIWQSSVRSDVYASTMLLRRTRVISRCSICG
jgi:hypothetical protein